MWQDESIPELIAKGYVTYPYIGATIMPLFPEVAKYLKLKVEKGAMIAEVVKGGPADKAGLKGGSQRVQVGNMIVIAGGDIVVKVDQHEVKTNDELIRYIREKKAGRHDRPPSLSKRGLRGCEGGPWREAEEEVRNSNG